MAVGAFKTKYTGQQMEELFDKLSSSSGEQQAGKGQYYSTETPILSNNGQNYKHGIMTIQSSCDMAYFGNIFETLHYNANRVIAIRSGNIIYNFDVPVNIKRINFSDHQQAGCTLYYYKDNSWVSVGTIKNGTTTLDIQNVQQLKVSMDYNRLGYSYLHYCIFDFITDEYVTGMSIKDGIL